MRVLIFRGKKTTTGSFILLGTVVKFYNADDILCLEKERSFNYIGIIFFINFKPANQKK